jgi:hypothetical protein
MLALHERLPDLVFDIYTQVPEWVFTDVLGERIIYHPLKTDIGLVQSGPFDEDLPATLHELEAFYPLDPPLTQKLATELSAQGDTCVLCDVAPLGIAAAHQAGLPACLIQNFTWDWIYTAYLEREPGFAKIIPELGRLFTMADFVVRTEPACLPGGRADCVTGPVSRPPRLPRNETRQKLGISPNALAILVTLGGMTGQMPDPDLLSESADITWILPGAGQERTRVGSCIILPHHSEFYHPDLVEACDAVIGKVGYSTLAEVYRAGIPFGFIPRPGFPESPVLTGFALNSMTGMLIEPDQFASGSWVEQAHVLLALPKMPAPERVDGAAQAAEFILNHVCPIVAQR